MLYYLPLYLEAVKRLSPTLTGVGLLGITGGLLPSSAIVGIIMSRTGSFRWAIWAGWCVTILGTGLMLLFGPNSGTATWVVVFVVLGLGHGLLLSGMGICVQAISHSRDVAFAVAMYSFVRTSGMCIGVGISGTIFSNQLPKTLAAAGLSPTIAIDATSYFLELKSMPVSPEYRDDVSEAYAQALRTVFEALTGISALGGIISLMIKSHTMNKPLESEHVFRRESE